MWLERSSCTNRSILIRCPGGNLHVDPSNGACMYLASPGKLEEMYSSMIRIELPGWFPTSMRTKVSSVSNPAANMQLTM